MKPEKAVIAIDLGGTKLALGKVVGSKVSDYFSQAIPLNSDKETLINLIIDEIRKLISPNIKGIGIGVPSVVDTKTGIVYDVQNIPSWNEVPIKDILEKEFKVEVAVNNDANCFALGEMLHGSAKSYNHVAGVVVGTGIGLGLIIDGKLIEGSNCGAGEIGMIPYQEHNYEYYSSGQYFINEFKMRGEEAYDLALKGSHQALMIFDYFGKHFGNALLTIIYAYDPEVIVIGGSVAKAREFYEPKAIEAVNNMAYGITKSKVKIYFSELENVALLGAAGLITK